jgi:hypothetical protein
MGKNLVNTKKKKNHSKITQKSTKKNPKFSTNSQQKITKNRKKNPQNKKKQGYDKTGNTKIVVAPRIETEKELENDLEREKTGKMERFRSLF